MSNVYRLTDKKKKRKKQTDKLTDGKGQTSRENLRQLKGISFVTLHIEK